MSGIGFRHLSRGIVLATGIGLTLTPATGTVAVGQTLDQIRSPAELPPASYENQTYVDSRGCVFLRAAYGDTVNWIARVDANRRALCGYPPSLAGAAPVVADAPAAAPVVTLPAAAAEPTARSVRPDAAANTVGETPAPRKAQRRSRTPLAEPARVAAPAPPPITVRCYTNAPMPKRFRTMDGRDIILCTRGDGTTVGLRAPDGSRQRFRVLQAGPAQAASVTLGQPGPAQVGTPGAPRGAVPIPGQDDLNTVWTREIPARIVHPSGAAGTRVVVQSLTVSPQTNQHTVVVMTKPDGFAEGATYVQIGTYRDAANADRARAQLHAQGLSFGTVRVTKDGREHEMVLVGPFATRDAARSVLVAMRHAGFPDAILR